MLTRGRVLALAWPVVLAQVATALTGVVDTAVIGNFGDEIDLAAVAVAAVTFSFLYWGFGFLRMATTGLTAQAMGQGNPGEARTVLMRGLILGGGLGGVVTLAFPLVKLVAMGLFQAEAAVEAGAVSYMDARIWGAPAALMGYATSGWLLGTGRTRALLALQVVLNASNAALDAWFVSAFDWGPAGIGAGTAIAEWLALGVGLWLVRDGLGWVDGLWDRERWIAMATVNRDVMIRTLALLGSFAWFVNAGTRVGSAAVAGNQVLLQFISVSAFVLDAFAFVAEKEIGEAVGAGDRRRFWRAIRLTTELALGFGVLFTLLWGVTGGPVVRAMVADPEARAMALAYLPYCAVAPVLGVAAWQLDGIFLGATQGRALRTSAVIATALYVGLDLALRGYGNTGVWIAFLASYGFRAVALGAWLPGLSRRLGR